MTSLTPIAATGGKIWFHAPQPQTPKTNSQKTKRSGHNLVNVVALPLFVIALIALFPAAGMIVRESREALPTAISKSALSLEYGQLNQESAIEHLKIWVPSALDLGNAKINQITLTGLDEGTKGLVTLTNGETIPFTLHNHNNGTFTVNKD